MTIADTFLAAIAAAILSLLVWVIVDLSQLEGEFRELQAYNNQLTRRIVENGCLPAANIPREPWAAEEKTE